MMVLLFIACDAGNGLEELQYCEDAGPPAVDPVTEPLTWHQDVAPIVAEKCGGCHIEGGLAPFPLESWEQVYGVRDAVLSSVVTGAMPPWSAHDCCGKSFRDSRALEPDQLDALVGWLDQGAPEGDPTDPAPLPETVPGNLSRVDLTLQMPTYEATPQNGTNDDVRCFLLEVPDEAGGRFVTGVRVIPGDHRIVHHVVVDVVNAGDRDTFQGLDDQDDDPGWSCYGGGGTGTGGNIGGYVPGQQGVELPEGLGKELPRGAAILLNMHYDLSSVGGQATPDATSVEFMLEDEVQEEVLGLAVLHPLWLYDEGMSLPGGQQTSYGFRWEPGVLYGRWRSFKVWGAFVHMHELGTSVSIARIRPDGEQECMLHIADWEFEWQADYWFDEPSEFLPGDALYIECHWDNPGEDIAWEADQEMCGGVLYVTDAD